VLHILICEDNLEQRIQIENYVNQYIAAKNVDVKLVVSTANPTEILNYLIEFPDKRALYLLDVDLQHDTLNGIELGAKVRETDQLAKVAFITTHSELAYLTYKHKIKAMDYIVKSTPKEIELSVIECISTAYRLYLEEQSEQMKCFTVNVFGEVISVPHDDILFFETHPQISKRMILHTKSSKLDFRELISNVINLAPEFYHCHKSFVVNTNNIRAIDKVARKATMVDGSHVLIATRKMPDLLKRVK